jgi:hypothetical protein
VVSSNEIGFDTYQNQKEAIDELKMNLRICKSKKHLDCGSMGCLKRVGIRTYAACQPQCRPPYFASPYY